MKHCPSCQSRYSDITLSFCLQDGTPLVVGEVRQSTIDTVAFSHPVTAQNILPTRDFRVESPPRNETQQYFPVNRAAVQPRKSRKGLIAMAIVLPVVMIAMAGGGAAWIYFAKQKQVSAKQETVATEKEKVENPPEPPVQPAVPETLKSQNTDVPKADAEAIKKEIADIVESWKDFTEGHNAEKLAAMYGEKVDYLGKAGKSAGEIRTEMQKTFDAFSEIDISISNMMVAVDAEGMSATALFDKEWSYEASPKLSEGKAHTKLHFQKLGSEWKIVTEKYLKIYYNEN